MKQYKYLYQKMIDPANIRKAYKNLRKGKTKRKEIQNIDANLDEEVEKMRLMILNTKPPDVPVQNPELAYKPCKRTPKEIFEHGKHRKIYMPEIHEQWLHHIIVLILGPIVMATAYKYTCGSFPKRGAHYGKKFLEKNIRKNPKDIRYFAKVDIRHFYDNIRLPILMRELRIRIKDEWFLYIVERSLDGFKKGVPLGFYISQWLANYLLEPLDVFVTQALGIRIYVRYMDDIVLFSANKKKLHAAIVQIRQLLGRRFRLRLKNNYQVCRFLFEKKNRKIGRVLDFMGFQFFREKTIIRKSIMLAAVSLAKRMKAAKDTGRRTYHRHAEAMLSYMGWFSCTDTYECYRANIKPYVSIKKLKKQVSKAKKKEVSNDRMDAGNLCFAA